MRGGARVSCGHAGPCAVGSFCSFGWDGARWHRLARFGGWGGANAFGGGGGGGGRVGGGGGGGGGQMGWGGGGGWGRFGGGCRGLTDGGVKIWHTIASWEARERRWRIADIDPPFCQVAMGYTAPTMTW